MIYNSVHDVQYVNVDEYRDPHQTVDRVFKECGNPMSHCQRNEFARGFEGSITHLDFESITLK